MNSCNLSADVILVLVCQGNVQCINILITWENITSKWKLESEIKSHFQTHLINNLNDFRILLGDQHQLLPVKCYLFDISW